MRARTTLVPSAAIPATAPKRVAAGLAASSIARVSVFVTRGWIVGYRSPNTSHTVAIVSAAFRRRPQCASSPFAPSFFATMHVTTGGMSWCR